MTDLTDAHDKVTEVLGMLNVLYDATQAQGIHDDHVSLHYAAFFRVVVGEVEAMDKLMSKALTECAKGRAV